MLRSCTQLFRKIDSEALAPRDCAQCVFRGNLGQPLEVKKICTNFNVKNIMLKFEHFCTVHT